ncbi:MAG: hypothetical protein ONB48_00485 [candidate division KSB1 bacterium]|nr:hypothetical protein [candidate division KSB1 bacterium]MDZ7272847.1 hypothetical protein [candidate division KSB1 bacterium]MDZ7284130.1 hypothetical protein [candidate division KSB1 bacterium]MDZ7297472.1 hypothetical protein [candidate division KSB1 bacterium]MDZ7305608.1 hypothetical protein [candidate division KSB1 bacterium]
MLNVLRVVTWLSVFFLALPLVRAHSGASRESLIQRSLEQLHCEQFDSALAICAELRRSWPDHPAGFLLAAGVYQTMMRDYRVRLFEARFDSLLQNAVALAEQQVRAEASAEHFFLLGTGRGYRGLHRFRCGEWAAGFRDAVLALNAMERALQRDAALVDPHLALGVYEYWKSANLNFAGGLFAGKREQAIAALESVRQRGRYVAIEAAYSLQTIYIHEKNYLKALEINDWLIMRFPLNISALYHRGLLLDKLDRVEDALAVWEKVIARIRAFRQASDGYLAECHWHRARLYERLPAPAPAPSAKQLVISALQQARMHARQRVAEKELEGPLTSFREINKAIDEMVKKYDSQGGDFRN